jgi:hypothetical protein
MGLFSKKGLSQLKEDFPVIKSEVGGIVVQAALKSGLQYSNAASTSNAMFEEVAVQLKKKLGYKLSAAEVSEFLNSRQFTQCGEGNELAGTLADVMFGKK